MTITAILAAFSAVVSFIKRYKKWFIAGGIALLIAIIVFLCMSVSNLRQENGRLSTNQTTLMSDIETYKSKDDKNVARITELELTRGEFEKLCEEQTATIKSLNLKVKNLQNMTTAGTKTEVEGHTQLKDTVIITKKDTVIVRDTVKHFEWSDPWNKISGIIDSEDNVDVKYEGVDTLNIIASKAKRKCLFGPTYIQVDIKNQNPSSEVVYARSIRLGKRSRK